MTKDFFLVAFCGSVLFWAVLTIAALHKHYRKLISEKNSYIINRIRECDRLEKELEKTKIEKELLEKLVISHLSVSQKI